MTVYRGVILFLFTPIISQSLYGFTWREALVCTWGGLRGAVGLALALAVSTDTEIIDCDDEAAAEAAAAAAAQGLHGSEGCAFSGVTRFKRVTLLHTCITVFVTLLFNAPSSGLLVKAVGLTKLAGRKVSAVLVRRQQTPGSRPAAAATLMPGGVA
jgi:NhaP-type Na+/H+ or K+/H+ antiporter